LNYLLDFYTQKSLTYRQYTFVGIIIDILSAFLDKGNHNSYILLSKETPLKLLEFQGGC